MGYLEQMAKESLANKQIRKATMRGLFLGSEATALRLEEELGRQIMPRKRGRKPRATSSLLYSGKL
jgi:hypothetical protein